MIKYKKIMVGLVSIMLCSSLFLYACSGWVAVWLIEKKLSQAGFSNIHVSVQRPTWKLWHIATLQGNNKMVQVNIQDMVLHYQWGQSFLAQLSIAKLVLVVQAQEDETAGTIPTLAWPSLPFSQLDIQQLVIHFPSTPATIAKGSLHFDSQQLQLKLVAHQADKKSGVFRVVLDQTGKLQVVIKKQVQNNEQDVVLADMQWTLQGNSWAVQGQAQVDMGLMFASVQTWLPLPKILAHATGEFHAQWQLAGQMSEPWQAIEASIQTSGALQLPDSVAQLSNSHVGLNTNIACEHGVCDWSFLPKNTLSTSLTLGKEEMAMRLLFPQGLKGQWVWQGDAQVFSVQSGDVLFEGMQMVGLNIQSVHIQPHLQLKQRHQEAWHLEEAHAKVQLEAIQWQQYHVYPQTWLLDAKLDANQLHIKLQNNAFHIGGDDGDVQSQFTLDLHTDFDAMMHDQVLNMDWTIAKHAQAHVLFGDLLGNMRFDQGLSGHFKDKTLFVHAGYPMSLSDFSVGKFYIAASHVVAEKEIQYDLEKMLLLRPLQLLWSDVDVRWEDQHYASQRMRLKLTQYPKYVDVKLENPTFTLESNHLKAQDMRLSVQSTLDQKQVKATLVLQSNDQTIHLKAVLEHQFDTKKGQCYLRLDPIHFNAQTKLSNWLVLPLGFEVQAGTCAANMMLHWQQGSGLTYQASVQLAQLSGVAQGHVFAGLDSQVQFNGDMHALQSSVPMSWQLAKLDAGLLLEDIMFQASFNIPFSAKPLFRLSTLQAKLLGGKLFSDQVDLDFNRAENPFILGVQQLDLAKILQLRQQKDVFATGLISGELPFNWTDQGLKLSKGLLHSDAQGGRIRYLPSLSVQSMASNQHVNMLLNAFNDFYYQKLTAALDYQANGLLQASIKLSGHNKTFQDGRTLNLNLNLEENILQLIRSLQIANDLGNKLGERAQELLQK